MYVTDCTFLNKILWILESLNYGIARKFDMHLDNAAVEFPAKFQSDWRSLRPESCAFES